MHATNNESVCRGIIGQIKAEKIDHENFWLLFLRIQLSLPASKIHFGSSGVADPKADPRHIEFQGDYSVEAHLHHVRLIKRELCLHGTSPDSRQCTKLQLQLQEIFSRKPNILFAENATVQMMQGSSMPIASQD
jgi:hypothetical protein